MGSSRTSALSSSKWDLEGLGWGSEGWGVPWMGARGCSWRRHPGVLACRRLARVPVRVCARGYVHVHRHAELPLSPLGHPASPTSGRHHSAPRHSCAGGWLSRAGVPPGSWVLSLGWWVPAAPREHLREDPQREALGREGGSWVRARGGVMAPFPRGKPRPPRSTQGKRVGPVGWRTGATPAAPLFLGCVKAPREVEFTPRSGCPCPLPAPAPAPASPRCGSEGGQSPAGVWGCP